MRIYTLTVGPLGTNCYLIMSEKRSIALVDPGADPERIIQKIEDLGSAPSMILLTHAHYDHTGGVAALCEAYPDCAVYLGEKDAPAYGDPEASLAAMLGGPKEPAAQPLTATVKEGDALALDELEFTVLETPGHTPGGVTYRCGDVLFCGDTLFQGSIGRTDFPGGDYETLRRSLLRLRGLPGEYTVCPGHGLPTMMSQERKTNPYLKG